MYTLMRQVPLQLRISRDVYVFPNFLFPHKEAMDHWLYSLRENKDVFACCGKTEAGYPC